MINLVIWLMAGAAMGWIASIVMHTNAQQGIMLNVVVGVIGAIIGGFLFGSGTINQNVLSVNALLVSLVGAVILLAIVNVAQRGRVR